jgi:hypothetical protein
MWKNMLMCAIAGISPYVLAITTSLFAISFSTSAYASQTSAQHKTLFKVPYLDEPTGLRVHFPGIARLGDDMEEPLRGGGPTTFCVSWDGRLFYIADPLRAYDKYLKPPTEGLEHSEGVVPWIQVYDRDGRWVRTIRLTKGGYPSRIRVDEQGQVYVDDAKQGVVVYRSDGSYDERRTATIADAVRRAAAEYQLDLEVASPEFLEVDRAGRVYFLARKVTSQQGSTKNLKACLLIIHPDGGINLLDYDSYRPTGTDKYRGELIICDYDSPNAEDGFQVSFTIYNSPDENPDNVFERYTIKLFRKNSYKWVRPDGQVSRKIEWHLDISNMVQNVWDGFVGTLNLERHMAIATDEAGNLYRVFTSTNLHWLDVSDPNDARRGVSLMDGFWIVQFTPDGRFKRVRASNLCLIGSYGHEENLVGRIINLWDVDKYGNVYWLEFHPTHVEIKVSSR